MKVTVIKPFEVWENRILKVSTEIIDIDEPIARKGIATGYLMPAEPEDIANYEYIQSKKVTTKNKEKTK
jgi:hypothetical protein